MERIVRLVYQASWDLAQQSGRPRLEAKAAGTARSFDQSETGRGLTVR